MKRFLKFTDALFGEIDIVPYWVLVLFFLSAWVSVLSTLRLETDCFEHSIILVSSFYIFTSMIYRKIRNKCWH